MGLFSKRGIVDRIKFDGDENQVIWKFPYDNLTTGAQLIVNQSQLAVFYKEGLYLDTFGPGTHTIETSNVPLLQTLVNLPFGGETPFTAEVWFVNGKIFKNNLFGTPSPVSVRDPEYRFVIPIRAFGQYSFKIIDAKKFMESIVGTEFEITTDEIQERFTAPITSCLSNILAKYAIEKKITVLDMPSHISEISDVAKRLIHSSFVEFGIEVVEFFIESINYPEDDPNVQKINEAYANKLSRDIEGTSYAEDRKFDVLDKAAANDGMAGTGMGYGVGMAMGSEMGKTMNMTQSQNTPPPPPLNVCFYISNNGQQAGPYNLTQIRQMIQMGEVNKQTYVWKEGYSNWIVAAQAQELSPFFASVPPPFPPSI